MKSVLLLLCEGVEWFEAAAFHDVLGWSGEHGSEPVQVTTVGLKREVTCTFGTRLIPDALLAEIEAEKFDALAIPGGFESFGFYGEAYSEPVVWLIRRFGELNKPVASICVGALPIAHAGLLAGRRATTYHLLGGVRRKQLAEFGVEVVDQPLVRDGTIITSTSPATAVEVALHLLAELTGAENAARIRHLMGFSAVQEDTGGD
jgi:4-methyl-5(b-hydroxyethyl)-thiazole monophosphate biosynthesis